MFLLVLAFMTSLLNCSHEPSAAPAASSGLVSTVVHAAEDALCNAALSLFERGTDAVISQYVKPHLASLIYDAAASPNNDDSPSHVSTVKRVVSGDLSIDAVPKKSMEELVLAAVQKTLESKEKELSDKASQIEGMFTPKTTVGISAISGVVLAVIGTLAGAFGTKSSC